MKNYSSVIRLAGCGSFSQDNTFTFRPCHSVQGEVKSFSRSGIATQYSDGTFKFKPRRYSQRRAMLIKKLTHGRVSLTQNGDYLVTIRINRHSEDPHLVCFGNSIVASEAILEHNYGKEVAA